MVWLDYFPCTSVKLVQWLDFAVVKSLCLPALGKLVYCSLSCWLLTVPDNTKYYWKIGEWQTFLFLRLLCLLTWLLLVTLIACFVSTSPVWARKGPESALSIFSGVWFLVSPVLLGRKELWQWLLQSVSSWFGNPGYVSCKSYLLIVHQTFEFAT